MMIVGLAWRRWSLIVAALVVSALACYVYLAIQPSVEYSAEKTRTLELIHALRDVRPDDIGYNTWEHLVNFVHNALHEVFFSVRSSEEDPSRFGSIHQLKAFRVLLEGKIRGDVDVHTMFLIVHRLEEIDPGGSYVTKFWPHFVEPLSADLRKEANRCRVSAAALNDGQLGNQGGRTR